MAGLAERIVMRARALLCLIVVACVVVAGTGVSRAQCFTCMNGYCDDGWYKTNCIDVFANGAWHCNITGAGCASEGGGGGQESPLMGPTTQMISVVLVAAEENAISTILHGNPNLVDRVVPDESPIDLVARLSGRSPVEFGISGAVVFLGAGSGAVRTGKGDGLRFNLMATRGVGGARPGAARGAVVLDASLAEGEVLISRAQFGGRPYLAIARVQMFASLETRRLEKQKLIGRITGSRQSDSLGLIAE
jgi:hypothetical protein